MPLSPTRPPSSTLLRHGVACALACAPLVPLAAGAAPNHDELETVTVYAKRVTPVTRVAATVTVVDQERIQQTLAADIRDVVRYEPGLAVRNDPFRFGLDTISIRGLSGNRVAIEVDGVPAAAGFAIGSYADSGRAYVDPAFLRRIEFLRGPASSLYGSDAIAGIVAMTTLTPADVVAGGDGRIGLRTQAGYDGQDESWHAAAVLAGEAGPAQWLVGYVRRDGHESDTAAEVPPDPRDYVNEAALAKLVLPDMPGGPLTLTLEGGRLEQQSTVNAFRGVGRFVNTTLLEGDDRLERHRVSLHQSLGGGNVLYDSAEWRLYRQGTGTDQVTYETRRAAPPRTPAVALDRSFHYDQATLGLEFTAARGFHGASLTHDVVYGLEAAHSRLDELRRGLQTTLDTGAQTNEILGEKFPLRDMPLTDVTEVGVFLQDEVGPADRRWTLIPALRVDYYELSPESDAIYREDNPGTPLVGVDEVSLAPKLGATFRVSDTVTLFAQYAHGFRSPPPEDVNIGLEIPLLRLRALPNPDLKPERSDGYELGFRATGPAYALTASAFLTEYRDFIESKVNLGLDATTGLTLFQSQNVAEARIYGAELTGTLRLGGLRPALEGWSARLAASWTRGEDLVRNVPLNSIDPPRAVLGLRYDADSQRWGSELVVTAAEAKRDVDRSRADLYRTDGYATVDLLAHLRFTERLRLNVGLFNLTDESYEEWSDVRGRVVGDPLLPYYVQSGFNASATLHYSF